MPTAWYIMPYVTTPGINGLIDDPENPGEQVFVVEGPSRRLPINQFNTTIMADGGTWSETEVLGDRALVKVRASDATLTQIAQTQGIRRIPMTALDRTLSDLTAGQRTAIRNELLDAGYTNQQIVAALGNNLATVTLRQMLRFLASRRIKPRWDMATNTVIFDGEVVTPRSIEDVDGRVTNGNGG